MNQANLREPGFRWILAKERESRRIQHCPGGTFNPGCSGFAYLGILSEKLRPLDQRN